MEKGLSERLVRLRIADIAPARGQARERFDEQKIESLARSIRQNGLISPVTVRRVGGSFELIAGERRLRAMKLLGEEFVPALVRPADDREAALLTLIENVQREELNCLEVAQGIRSIMNAFGLSQAAAGRLLGMSQSSVANKLRLLSLPEKVREEIAALGLSERHARVLLGVEGETEQLELLRQAARGDLSVRQMEALARQARGRGRARPFRILLRDQRVLVNAVLNVVKQLNQAGVSASSRVARFEDRIEVTVLLPLTKQKAADAICAPPP